MSAVSSRISAGSGVVVAADAVLPDKCRRKRCARQAAGTLEVACGVPLYLAQAVRVIDGIDSIVRQ